MKKEGITVFALIITIVVVLILVSASIAGISNVVANSRITKFAEEIIAIEDKLRLYYIENDSAYEEGTILYSKEEILNMLTSDLREEFNIELVYNNDDSSTGFFIINNTLLGIDREYEDRVYIAAIPSLNVYYKNGIYAKGKNYFSISKKINGGESLRQNDTSINLSNAITQSIDGLKVTKATNNWTNKLGITIESDMKVNEKLYVKLNQKEVLLDTNLGATNIIYFDSLLSSEENGLSISSSSEKNFTAEDIDNFNNLEKSKKYLEVIKKDLSQNIVARVKVDLSNIDLKAPEINEEATIENLDEKTNLITLTADDSDSGISMIRYEYFKTWDSLDGKNSESIYFSDGTSNNNYIVESEYLNYNGKICLRDESGKFLIKVQKGVSSIKLIAVDNASNISNVKEIKTITENEIFYSVSEITNDVLKISFHGENKQISGKMEYGASEDKIYGVVNFENSETIKLNNIETVDNKIYIRVQDNNSNATRVIDLQIPYSNNTGVKTKEDSRYYNPYIPNGFEYVLGDIESGFVIRDVTNTDSKYNEFVWVPVDNDKVKFEKTEFGVGSIATFQKIFVDKTGSFEETNVLDSDIEASVEKYGGFYVSRYEISIDNVIGVPKSVKNLAPWSGDISKALIKANSMYKNNTDCKSTLITAKAYDSLVNWLSLKYSVTAKNNNGNFSGAIKNAGSNNSYVMNNIYDLLGNVAEYTTETYNGTPVFRGGYYGSTSNNRVMSIRSCVNIESGASVGIRAILYIKN